MQRGRAVQPRRRLDPDWDRGLARVWAMLLLFSFLVPVAAGGLVGRTIWTWDLLSSPGATGGAVIGLLLPYLYAIVVLSAVATAGRTSRGLALWIGAAVVVLTSIGIAGTQQGISDVQLFVQGGMGACFVAGPALIAAGNRQAKREGRSGPANVLAGFGGLALLGAFVIPLPGSNGHVLVEALFQSEVWRGAWMLALWSWGLIAFGIMGLASFWSTSPGLQTRISIFARVIPSVLPVALLLTLGTAARGVDTGVILLPIIRILITVYPISVLLAIGLARWLEGEGRADVDVQQVFG